MAELILHMHPLVRAAHYLFLLPFGVALWPLIINFRALDFVIYILGLALILFLIIYGNRRPLIASNERGLYLYLHHGREVEFHPFNHIINYHLMSNGRISIALQNDLPIILFLKRSDLKKLTEVLENINLYKDETAR